MPIRRAVRPWDAAVMTTLLYAAVGIDLFGIWPLPEVVAMLAACWLASRSARDALRSNWFRCGRVRREPPWLLVATIGQTAAALVSWHRLFDGCLPPEYVEAAASRCPVRRSMAIGTTRRPPLLSARRHRTAGWGSRSPPRKSWNLGLFGGRPIATSGVLAGAAAVAVAGIAWAAGLNADDVVAPDVSVPLMGRGMLALASLSSWPRVGCHRRLSGRTGRTRRWWVSVIAGSGTPRAAAALTHTNDSWGAVTRPCDLAAARVRRLAGPRVGRTAADQGRPALSRARAAGGRRIDPGVVRAERVRSCAACVRAHCRGTSPAARPARSVVHVPESG